MNRQYPAFRGIAIILVVLNHSVHLLNGTAQELGLAPLFRWQGPFLEILEKTGIFAVPVFLFLSGSFLVYAINGKDLKVTYKIIWENVKHVLWPYLIWSAVFYGFITLLNGQLYKPFEYLKFLIVGYPFNFVPILIFFYVAAPFLIRWSKWNAWSMIAALAFYQLFLLNYIYPGLLGFTFPGWVKVLVPPVISTTLAEWGLCFPLGLVVSLNYAKAQPVLARLKAALALLTMAAFAIELIVDLALHVRSLAGVIGPLLFLLFITTVKRNEVPLARQFETMGKKAYGIYLMNLIVITSLVNSLKLLYPKIFTYELLLVPLLFVIALAVTVGVITFFERWPYKTAYRYVFG